MISNTDRTASLLTSNAASGSTHAATTLATVGRLSSHLGEFAGTQAGAHQHIISETNDFKKRRLAVSRARVFFARGGTLTTTSFEP